MAVQDYISTSNTDGPGNRISFLYDLVLTDNYCETVSSYQYFMNLAASLGSLSKVENYLIVIFKSFATCMNNHVYD